MFLRYPLARRTIQTMPIYEYECTDCGEPFEELVLNISSNKEVHCPNCESKSVKKKISLFGARASSTGTSFSSAACTTST
jgi:putative FmdB family regulatory protein